MVIMKRGIEYRLYAGHFGVRSMIKGFCHICEVNFTTISKVDEKRTRHLTRVFFSFFRI